MSTPAPADDAGNAHPQYTRVRYLSSAGWVYPVKGIFFFAQNSYFWPLVRARLIPCIILSFIVLSTLFLGTYLPQAAFLKLFHPHSAALVNAAFLVLAEGAAITALLFEAFFVDETLVSVFDATLIAHGHSGIVAAVRPVDPAAPDPVAMLLKAPRSQVYAPFSCRQIVEFVLLLPVNLIPWVGVPLFLWLTGHRAGPLAHHRYFAMRGLDRKGRKAFIKSRRIGYTGFGSMALVLQLIPVLSMLFLMTSACGSALWAVKCEEERGAFGGEVGPVAPRVVAPEREDEPPPPYEYRDDPV